MTSGTEIYHWNIPIPLPINLGDNRQGSLHVMGETYRNGSFIQAKIFFGYGDLIIVLWKHSRELDRFDFHYYPEEIWDRLNAEDAFYQMVPLFMTYENCMARTKRFEGDNISFEEFQNTCLGMAPPPVDPKTISEDIENVRRSINNIFRS
jgi:hypothetical protein